MSLNRFFIFIRYDGFVLGGLWLADAMGWFADALG